MKYLNKSLIFSSVLAASVSYALAEDTTSGKLTYEAAQFTTAGTTTGADNTHSSGDLMKQEISARLYFDGDATENATYHVELQAYNNSKAVTNNDTNEAYTQRDPLREAYIDTTYGDWLVRAGKQQVVWGTADGAKLLDMINPTDYTEMAQNQMEDSRIPVWMLNAEKDLEDGGNVQVIVSEPRENIFAGLNRQIDTSERTNNSLGSWLGGGAIDITATGTDTGHPFKLMGPDSITGAKNGFLNIVPDMGSIATLFGSAFSYKNDDPVGGTGTNYGDPGYVSPSTGVTDDLDGGLNPVGIGGDYSSAADYTNPVNYFTVSAFTSGADLNTLGCMFSEMQDTSGDLNPCTLGDAFVGVNFSDFLENMAPGSSYVGTLDAWTGTQALAGFAGMFGTTLFDGTTDSGDANASNITHAFEYMPNATFGTFDAFGGATSKYVYKMPSSTDTDVALRYKNSTPSGVNYSLNYAYAYDKNPIINMRWENSSGTELTTEYKAVPGAGYTLAITDGTNYYGSSHNRVATLVFEQETKRVHNIGGSFDMAIDTPDLGPVVIRGEALYMKDTYSPVMDRNKLSYGDLVGALTMRKGDRFKYVLGADITALTNMMVSVQFIRDTNLDHIDNNVALDGTTACTSANCGVYTVDYSTMHLSNGFNKAEKNKDFYSLFLSKPFGESGQHRWNNILMLEETGGRWNRFDIEYAIDDNTVGSVEWNKYWGDNNTQFGQLKNSSNIQVGLKYTF